ncbi:hypothetical protein N7526_001891 [Penicillium atrosanguineum]|nr:hypothetical protein N7526_001891 [Penicillium atrosanguineum]
MPTSQPQEGEPRKQIVVAITGATGTILGINLLIALRRLHIETHLIISKWAESTIKYETDYHPSNVKALADHVYNISDMAASISSGCNAEGEAKIGPSDQRNAIERHSSAKYVVCDTEWSDNISTCASVLHKTFVG